MQLTPTTARRRARAGFSLVELLVVVVLSGVILAALYRVIDRQQRFYAGVGDVMSQRLQLRQAATLLPLELRSISTIGGDILAFSDSTIEMRTHAGSGIICAVINGGNSIVFPPQSLASGQTLTSFTMTPGVGDRIFIYDEGTRAGNHDDSWHNREVSGVGSSASDCNGAPYTGSGDNGKTRPVVHIAGAPLPGTVQIGASVRIARQVKYELYKASDSNWYLGYQSFNGSGYNAMEPVAGPYSASSGIRLRFYRENGTQVTTLADKDSIARVDLNIKGTTSRRLRVDGMQSGQYADSLALTVAIRNRK